jgi:hypothetical protein
LVSVAGWLRTKTVVTYRLAVDPFVVWCGRHGVRTTADLTRMKLSAFRDALISRTKLSAKKGGKRGQARTTERKRSPLSINRELRTLKTLLNSWRQAGLVQLTRDDIADALKVLPVPREQPAYLPPCPAPRASRGFWAPRRGCLRGNPRRACWPASRRHDASLRVHRVGSHPAVVRVPRERV